MVGANELLDVDFSKSELFDCVSPDIGNFCYFLLRLLEFLANPYIFLFVITLFWPSHSLESASSCRRRINARSQRHLVRDWLLVELHATSAKALQLLVG